ncbi:MAG: hypothetical protein IT355_16610 [Gemmatimonadaceae bacterium]|nr:hypothetical protein [Gemmatimonadaceae bacterium]
MIRSPLRHLMSSLPVLAALAGCRATPGAPAAAPQLGQWIWTRGDVDRFAESAGVRPGLEAGIYIGSVGCDARTMRLVPRAGLAATATHTADVTVVIRFEDGLDQCRTPADGAHRFDLALDSAVQVLRARAGGATVRAVQLDHDVPQRALAAWARSVSYLHAHALAADDVWVTSLIAHLREPTYGDLFRDVVAGHVLQVFDTGEPATARQVDEAVALAQRARMPFRLGLGAFERRTRRGLTDHRAWFATVPQFAALEGYRGVWVFPAGQRWITFVGEIG